MEKGSLLVRRIKLTIGNQKNKSKVGIRKKKMSLDGLEPSTPSLKVRCSTIELKTLECFDPKGIRTPVIGMKIRCPRPD